MSFWSAIVLIVLITVVAGYFRTRGDSREHANRPEDPSSSLREKELENEVEALRERVKVLERIATDPARRTAEEIEKLRDE